MRNRILFISPSSCWPKTSGGIIRTATLAEVLSETCDIHFVSLHARGDAPAPPGIEEVALQPADAPSLWRKTDRKRPLAPKLPEDIIAQINDQVRAFRPDLIFLEQTFCTGVLEGLEPIGAKTVFSTHNVDSDLYRARLWARKRLWLPGNLWRRILRAHRARRQDMAAVRETDFLVTCSALDQARYRNLTGISSMIVQNPIPDQRGFDLPIAPKRYQRGAICFVGLMSYEPNIEAARVLVTRIAPHLGADEHLVIAGREADGCAVLADVPSGIEVLSDPPDILPVLEEAAYSIMPIISGGGTRLKALEAMAAGVVIIATQKAVEGLGLVPDTHYKRAETPSEMLAALRICRADPEAAHRIAVAARALMDQQYSGQVLKQQLGDAVAQMLA